MFVRAACGGGSRRNNESSTVRLVLALDCVWTAVVPATEDLSSAATPVQ